MLLHVIVLKEFSGLQPSSHEQYGHHHLLLAGPKKVPILGSQMHFQQVFAHAQTERSGGRGMLR